MRRLLAAMALLWALSPACAAAEILPEQAEMAQTDQLEQALPDEAAALLPPVAKTEAGNFPQGLERIGQAALAALRRHLPQSMRTVGLLLGIVLLCSLVHTVGTGGAQTLRLAGALAIAAACTAGLQSVFAAGQETLDQLQVFSAALLTTLSASVAATGAVTTAAALHAGTAFFLNLLLRLVTSLLLPLVYGFVAAGTAAAALGNETLSRVAALLKWFVTLCLKAIATAFVAYLTLSGVVSGSADGTAVKALKLAVSTAVPVVGSIISDAAETVLVSAGMLKNAVGVFGLLGAFAICAVPFARIGLQYLGLKLSAALSAVVDSLGLTRLLDVMAAAMGMILAMTAVALLLAVFSCVCALRLSGA